MLKLKATSASEGEVLSPKATKKADPGVYYVQKTIGSDTWLVMAQSQVELEDEWTSLYYTTQNQSNIFLQPPYEPLAMFNLVRTNNTLNQCIEAMEVNVDATGYDFDPVEGVDEIDEGEAAEARGLFDEPCPGESGISIRRKLRRQMETVGYAFLEILRNVAGDVVGWRNVETHNVRMVKLDAPVMVTKTVQRNGKDVQLQMWVRERRFAQRVALKTLVYYREFGATRNVDRNSGRWETDDNPVDPQNRGTELLVFGLIPDTITPYFLPRWENQMPSVVGSRKAEEQNLQFLDSGGMPPAIIFVQGGVLAKDASDQLRMYLSGQNKQKYRAVVVEAQSSSGSLDAAGNVQVKVERFGAEKANDAMFMNYDERTEEHVRVGFRLPPLFLGKPQDYNFSTAQTAYMVAEAQVFLPERDTFDAKINSTVMKAMGWKTLKYHSKPLSIRDIDNQMGLLGLVKDVATRDSFLDEVNQVTGMKLVLAPQPQPDTVSGTYTATDINGNPVQVTSGGRPMPSTQPQQPTGVPGAQGIKGTPGIQGTPGTPGQPGMPPQRGAVQKPEFQQPKPPEALANPAAGPKPKAAPKKTKKASELLDLAHDYAAMRGLVKKHEVPEHRHEEVRAAIAELEPEDQMAFNTVLAQFAFGGDSADLVGITAALN